MNLTFLKLFFGPGASGRKLAGLLLSLLFAQIVSAQTYVNNQNVSYFVPGPPLPPQINATAFVNQNIFSVTYTVFINNQIFYSQPWWGTLFYTNNGQLISNEGFEFDLQQTNSNTTNMLSDTFFNPGSIQSSACLIQATNVIVPGSITVFSGGPLFVNGQNVDFSRSTISIQANAVNAPNAPFSGTGVSGVFTNIWNPSTELLTNQATSARFPLFPFTGFQLFNSLPYNQETGSNLNRSAFVENDSPPNVTYSVFFGATNSLGSGDVTIEFKAGYLNFATGQLVTNHLYLNDDYLAGAVTNVPLGPGGWPANFVLTQSATELLSGTNPFPALPALPVFDPGNITNVPYAFAEFFGNGTGSTNISVINPSGSITNLSGQVRIVATRELNLNLAQITDPEYMSLTATNQFDGSAGADIDPLFSDMNLGSTNGSLTISNLIASQIPDWNGTIQAWSTRWLDLISNTVVVISNSIPVATNVVTITNDWRTVLVSANLNPNTPTQIRNLTLNSSNSLVISDVLNVFGTMFASAQNLTLTTNGIGTGAGSADGELDLQNVEPTTWSWPGSFPNVLWITNNGAINLPNFAQFIGTSRTNQITTNTPATVATATLTSGKGTNVLKNNTVTIGLGATPYTFTNSITSKSPPYSVLIGRNFEATMTNLIAAINHGAGGNKVYSTNGTFKNGFVTAGPLSTNVTPDVSTNYSFTVTSIFSGTNGDIIPVGTTATNLFWNPANLLAGGSNSVPGTTNVVAFQVPFGAIINNGLISDQGSLIWVTNFQSGGLIENGAGSFTLTSITTTLTNGLLVAGGDITLAGTSLTTTNLALESGRALVLDETNLLTDQGQSNANTWIVGSSFGTGASGKGLELQVKPANGGLLGTTIYLPAQAPNKKVSSSWAAADFGASASGYNNNAAIGRLILDALGPQSQLQFSGTGAGNAIYVDQLVLNDYASTVNAVGTNIPTILINTNFVIYYANAIASTTVTGGPFVDVSAQLNGFNSNRFRRVNGFVGIFNSTSVSIPAAFLSQVVQPQAPAINGTVFGQGQFLLTISGSGSPVIVQASTNLLDWANISTNTPPFTFTDTVTSLPYRFYRVETP